MFTDFGPVLLIPSAWAVTAAAHFGLIGATPVKMMHLAMTVFLLLFAFMSRGKMQGEVLSAWQKIILAGTVVTSLATLNLFYEFNGYLSYAEIVYWMVAPAYGFYFTRRIRKNFYLAVAALSLSAAIIFSYSIFSSKELVGVALAVAAVSQTTAIVEAAFLQNLRKSD